MTSQTLIWYIRKKVKALVKTATVVIIRHQECSEDELCQECIDKAEQESGAAIGGGDVDRLERRMRKTLIEDMTYRSSNGVGKWGKMEIVEPPTIS